MRSKYKNLYTVMLPTSVPRPTSKQEFVTPLVVQIPGSADSKSHEKSTLMLLRRSASSTLYVFGFKFCVHFP